MPAQLAHCQNDHGLAVTCRSPRHAVTAAMLPVQSRQGNLDTGIGKIGKITHRFVEVSPAGKIAKSDADQFPGPQLTQKLTELFRIFDERKLFKVTLLVCMPGIAQKKVIAVMEFCNQGRFFGTATRNKGAEQKHLFDRLR